MQHVMMATTSLPATNIEEKTMLEIHRSEQFKRLITKRFKKALQGDIERGVKNYSVKAGPQYSKYSMLIGFNNKWRVRC